MSDEAQAAPLLQPDSSPAESFEENEHWSESYKLRAMFLEILMVVVWAGVVGWGCFVYLPATMEFRDLDDAGKPRTSPNGNYILNEVTKENDDGKTVVVKDDAGAPKIDRPFGSFLVYADDGSKNDINLYIFLAFAGLPLLVVGYRAIYRTTSLSYTLTDHRLIVREGLFAREERQLRLIQIRDLAVRQHFLQMIFGVGTVIVFSNDADTPEVAICGIRDPRAVKERIFKISEEKKSKKEIYMGQA